ncbi:MULTISPECIES: UDP-N-acetylmuramate--L-alanine ligase [unclassified Arthrobacter]|uniref:UDP-N-acetylmuramate--L-alanine ligase n=1 Tax=unclassified Arthrobacter TaxID=235627 RepID=UPI002E0005D8|nr:MULTISPECIES: UDP-N-acetylmuramate--L-alanine ligase [unclassified Arthrobacter]MEC5192331.1 UDP-N-acetylmuramate--alanine ligase [Arthrobacter sp. MP_M4]MEC5203768.1 UDP-N-acetylmuramate--alanine ligase [Arthrobacter sp. MP_M7]
MTQPDHEPEHHTESLPTRTGESLGRVHFIGIGGVGMSAVARVLVARGLPVSGSDAKDLPVMADLAAAGARICVGYDAVNLGDAQSVVAGSAIRADNPEMAAAHSAGLPVLHRSEALAAAMAADTAVTVAGTHGKSTTTSMITVLLQGAGLDPSFAIGANVPALGVNAASGTTPIFVAEADESDGSFLNYRPQIAVVTNVEPDHLDYYGTAEAVYASFDRFTALLPADGVLVACADDAGARALARRTLERGNTRVVLYGTGADAELVLHDGGPGDVSISTPEGRFPLELHVPGRHNALNAAAAFAVALELGVDPGVAAGALAHFTGASRRFEFKGEGCGVRVYDDYAHHPTEVRAALAAARSVAGGHKLHVLFQPHLFSRTREFAAEFADALNAADSALVLDIYPAREDPIPGVTSQLIAAHLGAGGRLVGPGIEAVQSVVSAAAPGDIVLTVGAGDVTAYGPLIVAALNAAALNGAYPNAAAPNGADLNGGTSDA